VVSTRYGIIVALLIATIVAHGAVRALVRFVERVTGRATKVILAYDRVTKALGLEECSMPS